ncbi:tRNA:m(4)X modification enzyme TRM13 homolog [Limulus polyphemus]|uniref:tRNA:m(4)X modification enzyme TRM13 n=1 Tax=Limulus polyphemus TaxID=6850 RepID=A0ABM1BVF6_LIMPO|nr:tRNA:m(4)X modification enzyme TRM13 homolog [Limulus polyphemus]
MEHQEIRYCSHFLERKGRFCKMKALPGLLVCGEHCPLEVEECNKGKRIQCPLDGSHTCFAKKLESHLKKCNARKKELPVYYSTNVNSGHASQPVEKVKLFVISFSF